MHEDMAHETRGGDDDIEGGRGRMGDGGFEGGEEGGVGCYVCGVKVDGVAEGAEGGGVGFAQGDLDVGDGNDGAVGEM